MKKNQTPLSDSMYYDAAACTQCGAVVSTCDSRCPECGASFRSDEDEALDRYNQLYDQGCELVEDGDVASARRVFAEADKVRA
jgi:predicted amidophosphoribosyltransferase